MTQPIRIKDHEKDARLVRARVVFGAIMVVALIGVCDGKVSLVVGVTDDLTARINAVELVQAGAAVVGGKGGGGRAAMAQAGGNDPEVG